MDFTIVGLVVLVFAGVGAATAAALWLVTDPQVAQRRLAHVAGTAELAARESLLNDLGTPVAKRVRQYVPKSPKEMRRIERMLATAGYHGPWPAIAFSFAQIGLAIGFFLVVFNYFGGAAFLMAIVFGAIGYIAPTFWLGRAIEARKREIRNGLPDAVDLLIVCIEAGSGLDQALGRVAEELALPYPALAAELTTITAETRAGKPRLEAFKNFADRTKVDDVRSLVNMLVQTDRFGTSIGQALRTHADTSRTKRRQRAEEKAAKLGVKLVFPLILFLFPAFYVVVLGPSMIKIWRDITGGAFGL